MDHSHKILAIDTEATGVDVEKDRIVQFSIILLDENLNELSSWTSYVNPEIPIPPEVTKIHHITDNMVAFSPKFKEVANQIRDLITDDVIICAYNSKFDVSILHYELVRAGVKGIPVTQPRLDGYHIEKELNSHKLSKVYERYTEKELKDAHGAEADNRAHLTILQYQRALYPKILNKPIVESVVKEQYNFLDWGRKFYKDDEGTICFAFGKFKDYACKDNLNYLKWMLNAEFSQDVKDICKEIIKQSEVKNESDVSS